MRLHKDRRYSSYIVVCKNKSGTKQVRFIHYPFNDFLDHWTSIHLIGPTHPNETPILVGDRRITRSQRLDPTANPLDEGRLSEIVIRNVVAKNLQGGSMISLGKLKSGLHIPGA